MGQSADWTRQIKDPLTGLPNRTFFAEAIELALHQRHGHPGLLFCDMDGFKQINHRLGGDEFVVTPAPRDAKRRFTSPTGPLHESAAV